jgi:aspartyl-tRNA(Asn)/glutamyl-tRNA(Gln) amidotransferase subunit C
MKVTEKDVAYVADLANLELTPEEHGRMLRDLNSILDYVAILDQLDTKKVEPMAQVSGRYQANEEESRTDRFDHASRDDVRNGLRESLPHEVALQNAPASDGTFFEVPKVIER